MTKGQLYTDGGSRGNPGPAAAGCLLYDQDQVLIDFTGVFLGSVTNNQAEYEGLLAGLKLALKNGITDLTIYMDSELVVKQIKGEYKIKDSKMQNLKAKIDNEIGKFKSYNINHVMRNKNQFADKLVNLVLDNVLK